MQVLGPQRHFLKCWPEFYEAIENNFKRFEIRKDDRNYKVGDVLVLRKYDPATEEYPGGMIVAEVTYILSDTNFGVHDGFVCMGIKVRQ